MQIRSTLERALALGLLCASLAGCGGGGHRNAAVTAADKTATAFKSGNFDGTFGASPALRTVVARGTAPTTSYLQLSGNAGVVAFSSGTVGQADYRTFSADVANLDFTPQSSTANGATGILEFDVKNFTTNDFIAGTAHFTGTYSATLVGATYTLAASGKLVGTTPSGGALSLGYGLNYVSTLPKADLSGTYAGTIDLPAVTGGTVSTPWSGTLTAVDDLHLKAAISTGSGTIAFTGQNTRLSFAGAFDGAQVNSLLTGDFAQWYVRSDDGGATLTGAYFVVDATGAPVLNPLTGTPIYGAIAAKRSSSGGGTTTATLKTGYYDGGVKGSNGALDGRILKLNVTKVSATAGNNGGMVIVTNSSAPNIGGRVASVTGNGSVATVTIDQISNTYRKIVLTGPVSGTSFAATYVATKTDGTTETGSLDGFGQGSTTTLSLTGSWSGTATSAANGKANAFAATFTSNGDGTVTIKPTSTVGGGTYPTVAIPSFTAYQAGGSFAGHVSGTVPVTSLGSTFNVAVVGDFDGDANSTAIVGTYAYGVFSSTTSTTPILADAGALSLRKG